MEKKIYVSGMKCTGCADHVKEALNNLEGVKVLDVNYKNKFALVETERELEEHELVSVINNGKYKFIGVEENKEGIKVENHEHKHHCGCC